VTDDAGTGAAGKLSRGSFGIRFWIFPNGWRILLAGQFAGRGAVAVRDGARGAGNGFGGPRLSRLIYHV
jgi:hypothetical protein